MRLRDDRIFLELRFLRDRECLREGLTSSVVVHQVVVLHRLFDLGLDVAFRAACVGNPEAEQDRDDRDKTASPHVGVITRNRPDHAQKT
jgi:hypothetical protein